MSARIENVDGPLVTIRISGRLTQQELAELQQATARTLLQSGPARILIVADNFQGWERGGDWEDLSFQQQYDPLIERMAIVGEKRWEDLVLLFTFSAVRKFPLQFFTPDEEGRAREWLAQPA